MGTMGRVCADIEHVTIYARGARVRRVTTTTSAIGTLRIAALPLAVIDDTLRVEVEGPAVAATVRAGVDAPATAEAAAEEPSDVRDARRRVALAETEIERLAHALEHAQSTQVVAEDPSDDPPASWTAILAARRALVALKAERVRVVNEGLRSARREHAEANRALVAAIDRERRSGTARGAKLHELRKHVDIEVTSTGDGAITVRLEYLVAAARWTPSYVVKLDGADGRFEIRANVAQQTGEDWLGVPLALSTAEPTRFAALPELLPQRIGRRQDEPARTGFRAPPTGAGELYADYLRERSQRPQEARQQAAPAELAPPPPPLEEDWDEGGIDEYDAYDTPMPMQAFAPAPAPMKQSAMKDLRRSAPMATRAAAMPAPPKGAARFRKEDVDDRAVEKLGGGGGAATLEASAPGMPAARLDYGNLRMAPPAAVSRGQLVTAPADHVSGAIASEVASATARIAGLPLPVGCHADWAHTYDYAFATDGAVDVKSDGAWHSIGVTARPSTAKVAHVAVPREQPDVFRVAAITNPFEGPLLPGPIDVYDRGRFLVTSSVDYTPPAGAVEIGLGVDPAVKIARNTEFREEATGMLRGGLLLVHAVTIDVENLSGRSIDLEVRERIPVAREGDDDVTVSATRVEPAWERWTPDPDAPTGTVLRGGHRWRLALPAGQKQKLRAGYEVKIAAKHELVGGNRREL